jgi:hypothetical protein
MKKLLALCGISASLLFGGCNSQPDNKIDYVLDGVLQDFNRYDAGRITDRCTFSLKTKFGTKAVIYRDEHQRFYFPEALRMAIGTNGQRVSVDLNGSLSLNEENSFPSNNCYFINSVEQVKQIR